MHGCYFISIQNIIHSIENTKKLVIEMTFFARKPEQDSWKIIFIKGSRVSQNLKNSCSCFRTWLNHNHSLGRSTCICGLCFASPIFRARHLRRVHCGRTISTLFSRKLFYMYVYIYSPYHPIASHRARSSKQLQADATTRTKRPK